VIKMIVDADGNPIGRLGTFVAKKVLSGENVIVINAEKAIISGNKQNIIKKYLVRRSLKQKANPEHSPKWPRRPDLLVKRIIRGMLPYDKAKGRSAYKKLRVYIGVPKELEEKIKSESPVTLEKKDYKKYITILDLCKELGWRG
jgi:large subunit ribosomal protein L13